MIFTKLEEVTCYLYANIRKTQLNLTLPEWTYAVFPEPLTQLRGLLFFIEVENPIARQILAGPMLNVLASDMLNIANRENELPQILYTSPPSQTRPLHLFSAHDSNIVILRRALNAYNNVTPNYGAAMGFELRSRDNTYFVRVIYENSFEVPPQPQEIPGCLGSCTLNAFLSLIEPIIPDNWDALCSEGHSDITTTPATPNTSKPTPSRSTMHTSTVSTPTIWTPPSWLPPGWVPTGSPSSHSTPTSPTPPGWSSSPKPPPPSHPGGNHPGGSQLPDLSSSADDLSNSLPVVIKTISNSSESTQ